MLGTISDITSVKKNDTGGGAWNYQVTMSGGRGVIGVPNDPDNRDYQAIQEWVAEGNTIEESGE